MTRYRRHLRAQGYAANTVKAKANRRTRAFLVLGAFAGLRSFEMAKVRGDDVEQTPDGPALRVHGKGDRIDLVPVPPVVVRELQPWRLEARDGRLWPDLTPEAVQEAVRRCARGLGLSTTCHQLRHRYGTALYAESHDLLLVQQLMRHESPSTTAGYALVANTAGASLVRRLPIPTAA